MDVMEMETRRRMGKSTWKQYAFQIVNSTHLQYFSKVDKVYNSHFIAHEFPIIISRVYTREEGRRLPDM